MGRPRTNKYSLMSTSELLEFLRQRYLAHGIGSLSYPELKKEKGLYFHIYGKGLKLKDVISELGLNDEYREYKDKHFTKEVDGNTQHRWTWDRVIEEASLTVEEHGFLPPAQWFQNNRLGSLVFAVYKFNKTWEDLREHFDSFHNSSFVQSRNEMRWRSHPEASLSNFLYARGIEHKKGEKYPDDYDEFGDASYGYYDAHFRSRTGTWVDVEIWGDRPNGHNEEKYKKTRKAKEEFNDTNLNFLGIGFRDCFSDSELEKILSPHIGIIEPFFFDKPTDRLLQSTHWSNADELIEYCKSIAADQPNGLFPTEEWLRKRGKWEERPGPAYNTVSIYIKTWMGGIRKLREILGQAEGSTIEWDRDSALRAYEDFHVEYGITPGQARTVTSRFGDTGRKKAVRILTALNKYFGTSVEANQYLRIELKRKTKWSKPQLIAKTTELFDAYGLTPAQVANVNKQDQSLFGVRDTDKKIARQIIDRTPSHLSNSRTLHAACKIEKTDIRILRRRVLSRQSTKL